MKITSKKFKDASKKKGFPGWFGNWLFSPGFFDASFFCFGVINNG